jgi:carbon storage regulator CsrA
MTVIRRKREGGNGNLVLHIKKGETLLIDGNIRVILQAVESRDRVKLVVNAPQSVRIRRKEFEERDLIQIEDPEKT